MVSIPTNPGAPFRGSTLSGGETGRSRSRHRASRKEARTGGAKRIFQHLYLLLMILMAVVLSGCRKDNSFSREKMAEYLLLCPTGDTSVCYDNCGAQNDIGGSPTGSQMAAYESCKTNCDTYCSLETILLYRSE